MFKIKAGYFLVLLSLETMKLLGITKCKITNVQNGKNVPCLKITEVVLILCNVVKNVMLFKNIKFTDQNSNP